MEPILQVSDLTVNYRGRGGLEAPAVAGVSFALRPGEAVGMLGESGCGKTTTALAMLRLLPANARLIRGAVRYRGKNLLELRRRELESIRGAEVAFIFHEPSLALNPVLRVGNQVAEVLRAHGSWDRRRRRQKTEELLNQVGLGDASRIYAAFPHELSGGQKQRILIAQALACNPSVIIADEPTVGLDACIQAEILELLRDLKQRLRTAFLFISHQPEALTRLADRLLVMYAGRIVEEGALPQVYDHPLHPYTQGLLRSSPPKAGEARADRSRHLAQIEGSPPDMNDLPIGCKFAPRCAVRVSACEGIEPPCCKVQDDRRVSCHLYAPQSVQVL